MAPRFHGACEFVWLVVERKRVSAGGDASFRSMISFGPNPLLEEDSPVKRLHGIERFDDIVKSIRKNFGTCRASNSEKASTEVVQRFLAARHLTYLDIRFEPDQFAL